jgi:hypothetical protein
MIWKAILVLFFCGGTIVASGDGPVNVLPRRMLLACTPSLVDCSVMSCSTPLALTGAEIALLCPLPGLSGAFLYGTVKGSGFNTDTQATSLFKQAFLSAEGLSFDVILSGKRTHYAHVQAHCAELFATLNGFDTASLPACVNPDGVVYILIGVYRTLEGVAPQLALLEVLVNGL